MEKYFLEPIKKIYHVYHINKEKNLGCFSHTRNRIASDFIIFAGENYPQGTLMAYWFHCRDIFQSVREENFKDGVLFYHRPNGSHLVVRFLHYFEKRLGLEFSKFQLVESDNQCLCIHPNPFWFETSIHKSFFSILLRASLSYKPNKLTPLATLMKCKEAKHTKYAVKRFLNGYTELKWAAFSPKMKKNVLTQENGKKYCLHWFGWVKLFKETPRRHIDRILVA